MMKTVKLIDIATVYTGEPIRNKISPNEHGDVKIVQMKDISDDGELDWNGVIRMQFTNREKRQGKTKYLQNNDVLFKARGKHNYAADVQQCSEDTIISPHLFLIRPHDTNKIISGFLAWQINQLTAQQYFHTEAEGSRTIGIRKPVLENLEIKLPHMDKQKQVLTAYKLWLEQKKVLQTMTAQHEVYKDAIARHFLDDAKDNL
ncbi:restriction endonuclease subunit S [Ghiorsea bivora]|uniref:restriction endonuclease subunit S n=1 Tax=Ghiorsea bivora TaxID=1485545 RepID=UPI00056E3891|nr:restriction endonuclease subunit S [Ghiorsea bivora]